jgi:hypothetical protein
MTPAVVPTTAPAAPTAAPTRHPVSGSIKNKAASALCRPDLSPKDGAALRRHRWRGKRGVQSGDAQIV